VGSKPESIIDPSRDPLKLRAELEARIQAIDRVGQAIVAIRDVFIGHPDLVPYYAPRIRGVLDFFREEEEEGTTSASDEPDDESTTLDRIVRFFADRTNRPAVMSEILDGVEGNPITIRQAIYKRHRDKFSSQGGPGAKRLWQLSELLWDSEWDCLHTPRTSDEDIPF
jgi:hypothetical protein